MNLTELFLKVPACKKRKRVGRGTGSGTGGTCGRGHKGQMARSGGKVRKGFEGGQMPLFRRLPKRGFKNALFMKNYVVVNLSTLQRFDAGSEIAIDAYKTAGLVKNYGDGIKILGSGEVPKNLTVTAHRFSASARRKIEEAGGKCVELSPPLSQEELAKKKPVRRGGAKKKNKAPVAAAAPAGGDGDGN